jgi:nitronate monooxygenase
MKLFDQLAIPLIQAPISSASSTELAAAVNAAGGMGSLALTWSDAQTAARQVQVLRDQTDQPFAVNFVLSFPCACLQSVLSAGPPVVTFSWGLDQTRIRMSQDAGALVGVQVGSVDGAIKAIEAGTDFVICQGVEAGGHVQSTTPLAKLLSDVVEIAGDTPVVAAGGLATGRDVAAVLALGASAAMLGTRFVATTESTAHPAYKQAIVKAGSDETSMSWCFDGGWPYSGHRVLRNDTLEAWESVGCPLPGNRPGESDAVAWNSLGKAISRYHIASPALETTGDVLNMALYAGTGCKDIASVQPAGTVVQELWQECQRYLNRAPAWPSTANINIS